MAQGAGAHSRMYRGVDTEQRRAERRERLLEAALDEFTTRGYHKTKIADLCAQSRRFHQEFLREVREQGSVAAGTARAHQHGGDEAHASGARLARRCGRTHANHHIGGRLRRGCHIRSAFSAAELRRGARDQPGDGAAAPGLVHSGTSTSSPRSVTAWRRRGSRRCVTTGSRPIALVGAVTGLVREWQAHEPPLPADEVATEIREIFIAAITRPVVASCELRVSRSIQVRVVTRRAVSVQPVHPYLRNVR